ncbi:MAG: alcohol dehydrogenase catalytic domain-containing protein [Clostridiales bacterium]|nr:alcohol dehydrogenase catalytic domain-containing protein [Clostridiales bacterium]
MLIRTACTIRRGPFDDPDPEKRGLIEVRELEGREMTPESIRIKVAYNAICGSEAHGFQAGWTSNMPPSTEPRGMGHEVSGVVVEVGEKAIHSGLKVGDRVGANFVHFCGDCYYCLNGMQQFCLNMREYSGAGCAEFVTWHEQQFYKLPDNLSLKEGCLTEPTAITVRMMDKMDMKVGLNFIICGGGPIGLLALQLANLYGAANLTLIEPIAARRELAKTFGAVHTIDPFNEDVEARCAEITGGFGFDRVLDASGAKAMMPTLLNIAGRGAIVNYGAMYPSDYEMPLNLARYMYTKELTVTGVMIAPYVFPRTVNIMPRLNLKPFTECIFPLEKAHDAMVMQLTGQYPKVLINCNADIADL